MFILLTSSLKTFQVKAKARSPCWAGAYLVECAAASIPSGALLLRALCSGFQPVACGLKGFTSKRPS